MKVKYTIIFLILFTISRPLYAQLALYDKCTALNPLHHIVDDKTIKKDKPPQQKGNEEDTDNDNLNDDTNEHIDDDEDLEDIPDDFYDYQEENFKPF